MIVELRVDERLTHGQVTTGWCHFFHATHLIVANDTVANSEMQRGVMKMGIPQDIKHMFCTIEKAIELVNNPKSEPHRIFIIVNCLEDALKIVNGTPGKINNVNLGNYGLLHKPEGDLKKSFSHFVTLDAVNLEYARKIKDSVKDFYSCTCVGNPVITIDNL